MSDLLDMLFDSNSDNKLFAGKKAVNFVRNLLTNLDLSKHNPNDILSSLRENNINITIPSFYRLYNEITGVKLRSQRIKYVNRDYTPSEGVLEPSLYPLQTKYRIVHEVSYTDLETGVELTRQFVLDTDVLSTISNMQEQVIDAMESRYPIEVSTIRTIGGYINKG